jgi:hypothetical protein
MKKSIHTAKKEHEIIKNDIQQERERENKRRYAERK